MIGPFDQSSYTAICAAFQWPQPRRYNIAEQVCSRWARQSPDKIALRHLTDGDVVEDWSYGRLERASNQLANVLVAHGLTRGARCAVLLPQRPEAVLVHLALYKIGAIALPLFTLFGPDALCFRLRDASAEIVVTDAENLAKLSAVRDDLPALKAVLSIDGASAESGAFGFWELIERARDTFSPVETSPDDAAFLCYTSGTTGPPKGALHGHRVLMGHLPGVQMWLEAAPKSGDVAWTPADWAWLGGLCNILLPCLNYGVPVVAHRMAKFDPERAYWIWKRFDVTVGFMPPTALKIMRSADVPPAADLSLRAIGSGGEPLGVELLDWGRETLGLTINEFYGQTECNLVTSNRQDIMPVKPGSIGPATPGFEVSVLDASGARLPAGEAGEIAVRRDTPCMFLRYWNRPDATTAKFINDWMTTGDVGRMDEEGYVFFSSRADDIITSAGYRIGPSEIEDCLVSHPAVAVAGVIGVPDAVRGEAVKAYVALRGGVVGDDALAVDLQNHVKTRLSSHSYPREVAFIDTMPMTATGKILRRELRRRHNEA